MAVSFLLLIHARTPAHARVYAPAHAQDSLWAKPAKNIF